MGVHLIGMYLTGLHLMGVYFINVHLIGVHLTGVHLMGIHLIDVPNPKGFGGKRDAQMVRSRCRKLRAGPISYVFNAESF
jgi:hypothetical protein